MISPRQKVHKLAQEKFMSKSVSSRLSIATGSSQRFTVSYLLLLDVSFPIRCQNSIDSSKIHVLCFLNQIINNRFDFSKIRVHCFLNQIINDRFDSSKMHVVCFLKYIINNSWTWTFFEESIIFWHLIGKLAS